MAGLDALLFAAATSDGGGGTGGQNVGGGGQNVGGDAGGAATIISDGLLFHLDASRADGDAFGGAGCPGVAATVWTDLVAGAPGILVDAPSPPCSAVKGWAGKGTPSDPYRLAFDGTGSWLDFGAVVSTATFTLSAWVRIAALGDVHDTGGGNGVELSPIVGKGGPETEDPDVDVSYVLGVRADNRIAVDFEALPDSASYPMTSVGAIAFGEWVHVAASYDMIERAIYIRGRKDANESLMVMPSEGGSSRLAVGTLLESDGMRDGGNPNGDIAIIRIYDHALTAEEIAQNCNAERARFEGASCDG